MANAGFQEASRLALATEYAKKARSQTCVRDASWFASEEESPAGGKVTPPSVDQSIELTCVSPTGLRTVVRWKGSERLRDHLRKVVEALELDASDMGSVEVWHEEERLSSSSCLAQFPEWVAVGSATVQVEIKYTPSEEYQRGRRTVQRAQAAAAERDAKLVENAWDNVAMAHYDGQRRSVDFALTSQSARARLLSDAPWPKGVVHYDARRRTVEFACQMATLREARLRKLIVEGPGLCVGSKVPRASDPAPDASWWGPDRPRPDGGVQTGSSIPKQSMTRIAQVQIPPRFGLAPCPARPPRMRETERKPRALPCLPESERPADVAPRPPDATRRAHAPRGKPQVDQKADVNKSFSQGADTIKPPTQKAYVSKSPSQKANVSKSPFQQADVNKSPSQMADVSKSPSQKADARKPPSSSRGLRLAIWAEQYARDMKAQGKKPRRPEVVDMSWPKSCKRMQADGAAVVLGAVLAS